jgi:hypothetical protein
MKDTMKINERYTKWQTKWNKDWYNGRWTDKMVERQTEWWNRKDKKTHKIIGGRRRREKIIETISKEFRIFYFLFSFIFSSHSNKLAFPVKNKMLTIIFEIKCKKIDSVILKTTK